MTDNFATNGVGRKRTVRRLRTTCAGDGDTLTLTHNEKTVCPTVSVRDDTNERVDREGEGDRERVGACVRSTGANTNIAANL